MLNFNWGLKLPRTVILVLKYCPYLLDFLNWDYILLVQSDSSWNNIFFKALLNELFMEKHSSSQLLITQTKNCFIKLVLDTKLIPIQNVIESLLQFHRRTVILCVFYDFFYDQMNHLSHDHSVICVTDLGFSLFLKRRATCCRDKWLWQLSAL